MTTFADILHKYFGLPYDKKIWKKFPTLDRRIYGTPRDYGVERWIDVDWNGEEPRVIKEYWDHPWTDEGDEAWSKFTALIDDMCDAGFITDEQRWDIHHYACDNSCDF